MLVTLRGALFNYVFYNFRCGKTCLRESWVLVLWFKAVWKSLIMNESVALKCLGTKYTSVNLLNYPSVVPWSLTVSYLLYRGGLQVSTVYRPFRMWPINNYMLTSLFTTGWTLRTTVACRVRNVFFRRNQSGQRVIQCVSNHIRLACVTFGVFGRKSEKPVGQHFWATRPTWRNCSVAAYKERNIN